MDESLDILAAAIKAALKASGEFQDVIVVDEGDGPTVKAYNDEFAHEFMLIIEPI